MQSSDRFRVRLRVRTAKGLTTDSPRLFLTVLGRRVTISSELDNQPLNQTEWLKLNAHDFSDSHEAIQFGTTLKKSVLIAAFATRIGIDSGNDQPSGQMTDEYARSVGLLKEGEVGQPNVHGLSILPDLPNVRFPSMNIKGTLSYDQQLFQQALTEAASSAEKCSTDTTEALQIFNLALMAKEPLTQMVMALSQVEKFGQNRKWSDGQKSLIRGIKQYANDREHPDAGEKEEVLNALSLGLYPLSLRQGVKRLLRELKLDHLSGEWDRLYGLRSAIFHGDARIDEPRLVEAAFQTLTLCGSILAAHFRVRGLQLPSITDHNFSSENRPKLISGAAMYGNVDDLKLNG